MSADFADLRRRRLVALAGDYQSAFAVRAIDLARLVGDEEDPQIVLGCQVQSAVPDRLTVVR